MVVVWIAATEGDDAEAAGVVDASMMAELVVSFTLLFPPLPPFPPALVDVLWAKVVFWNGGAVAKLLVVDLPPLPPRRVLVVDREASELVDSADVLTWAEVLDSEAEADSTCDADSALEEAH